MPFNLSRTDGNSFQRPYFKDSLELESLAAQKVDTFGVGPLYRDCRGKAGENIDPHATAQPPVLTARIDCC